MPRVAAPSYVWPESILENCIRLSSVVPEVGLLFFQTHACLDYTEKDLPPVLADMGLRYHVHLPLDLPWEDGPEAAWAVTSALLGKCAFLRPWAAVLHPPPDRVCPEDKKNVSTPSVSTILRRYLALWKEEWPEVALLVENIRENDLAASWPVIRSCGAGICLDLGHLLAYGQTTDAFEGIWPHVGMVHLNAAGPDGEHHSLRVLDGEGTARMNAILNRIRPDCVLMLELFTPWDFFESLAVLNHWALNTS